MNLVEFQKDLSARGVELWVESDKLRYRAPKEVLTPALLNKISQHKAEIIQLLHEGTDTSKTYPLSHGQRALWFLSQLAPESVAYNVAFTARIRSNVDVEALRGAFQALIARHPMLRTTYLKQDGEPIQQVHPYQEVCFEEIDASTISWDELNKQVVEAHQRPFDLEKGPVLRVSLFTRSEQNHVLLVAMHHIACDAWSIGILLDELRLLYPAQKASKAVSLPPINWQYMDYLHWQDKMLAGSAGGQLWEYWQQQLAGDLPVLNLPTDRPRPPVQSYQGGSHAFKLTGKLAQRLNELARVEGTTLYVTLLAAFQVLLYRYTGQEDILVGSPTAGRSQTEFAGIVGYFANPVVLRANILGNSTFKAFLSQVRHTVLSAIAHQDYPFPLLVERLQPNRDPSRSPIFQVSFVLQKPQQFGEVVEMLAAGETGAPVDFGGLVLEPFEMAQQEGQFDLTLEIVEARNSLFGVFKYNTDLFDATTIARMVEHFQTLLEGIAIDPEQQVSELPLLTEAERHQVLVEWNNTQVNYPQDRCIHQLFEAQAERTPDAVAVIFEDEQLTYRELNARANQLAHHLQSLGVGPDVLVGICAERSLEMVVGLLGILKADGAYVPLDPSYPQERLSFMLKDSQVPVLLTQQRLVLSMPQQNARVVLLDADWEAIAQQSQENPSSRVTNENLAYTIYTSGSTGTPKGAMNTHYGIRNRLLWMQEAYELTVADRVLQKTPFSFDVSVWEFFWPLMTGARLVLAKPEGHKDSAYLVKLIAEQGITTLHFVPSMLQVFLEEPGLEACRCLRQVMCSGEALPSGVQKRFFARLGAKLHNLYGPTEAAIDVTFWECDRQSQQQIVPLGRPIANTQIYLLDSYLQTVPVGVPGELHIGGAGLARGYLNRPELTAQKFIRDPFSAEPQARLYKTGDLARYLGDGNIEYLGRIDHQVKIRGFRIELGEIEAVLNQHAAVRETVLLAREDIPGDKRLVAYIVSGSGQTPSINELRGFLKTRLPDYMIPSAFVFVDALPLTPNGKLDRRALPVPDTSRIELEEVYVAPLTPVEEQLAAIWSDVLGLEQIGIRDNFFDLGGHSLLALRLMAQIQTQFGQNLPLATLFKNATIERLARVLTQPTPSSRWSPLVEIRPRGSKQPIFCIPGAGANVLYLQELARFLDPDRPFYAMQARGLDGEQTPHSQIQDMAAEYIEAMQSVQPQGPYVLVGHCFGGYVAFEMALQLHEQGHEVALLSILGISGPLRANYPLIVPDRVDDDAELLTTLATRFFEVGLNDENPSSVSYDELKQLEPEEQLNYWLEKTNMFKLLDPIANRLMARGLLQVRKANLKAILRYMPQEVYPHRITLLRGTEDIPQSASEQNAESLQDMSYDWSNFSVEPVEVIWVPGNRVTMMAQPNVQVVAERLQDCLDLLNQAR